MSMHPDRGEKSTYRLSYGISTWPDYPNTLTCQSSDKNIPPGTRSLSLLRGILPWHILDLRYATYTSTVPAHCRRHNFQEHSSNVTIAASTPPLHQYPSGVQFWIHHHHLKFCAGRRLQLIKRTVSYWIQITVSDLIQLTFLNPIPLMISNSIWLNVFIWFN